MKATQTTNEENKMNKGFTQKQIRKMEALERKFGKIKWAQYIDNDGTVIAEGHCRILHYTWLVARDGKECQ